MRRTPPTWYEVTPEPGFLPIYKFEEGYFRGARQWTSYTSIAKGKQRRRGRLAEAEAEGESGSLGCQCVISPVPDMGPFPLSDRGFFPLSPFVCPVRPLRLVKLAPGHWGYNDWNLVIFLSYCPRLFFVFVFGVEIGADWVGHGGSLPSGFMRNRRRMAGLRTAISWPPIRRPEAERVESVSWCRRSPGFFFLFFFFRKMLKFATSRLLCE